MDIKARLFRLFAMLCIALPLVFEAAPAGAVKAMTTTNDKVWNFKFRGLFVFVFLGGGETGEQGFLNVGVDLDTKAVGLDFGYSFPDATNPDLLIIYQGAGEIPNDAFTVTRESAHLRVTTPASFMLQKCIVNIITDEFTCHLTTEPITFDLSWVTNGLHSISEKTERTETYLGTVTKFKGEYTRVSANVSGTWGDGYTHAHMIGSILDTQNKTVYRDINLRANP
jgi:hypothetical protein